MDERDIIARRIAQEIPPGSLVNLGRGIPQLVSKYAKDIVLYGENGTIGYGFGDYIDVDLIDGGCNFAAPIAGMSFVDSATSFAIARGGHLDFTVMGALQVSENGDLANWTRSLQEVGGIGGGMDMAVGARNVIIAIKHVTSEGRPKIVKRCSMPLTGIRCVNLIVTDVAVIEVTNRGLVLREILNGMKFDDVQRITEPTLIDQTRAGTFTP